jgi:hypothetical protein
MSADLLFAAQCCCGVDPPDNFCTGWESCLPQTASLSMRIRYEEELRYNDVVLNMKIIETDTTCPLIKTVVTVNGETTTLMRSSFGTCTINEERFSYGAPAAANVVYPGDCYFPIFCPCASGIDVRTLSIIGSLSAGIGILPGDIDIVCADGCPAGAIHPITGTKGGKIVVNRNPIDVGTLFEISNPDNGCDSENFETEIFISPLWTAGIENNLSEPVSTVGCLVQAQWNCNTTFETIETGEPNLTDATWFCGDPFAVTPDNPLGITCGVVPCDAVGPFNYPVVYQCGQYSLRKKWSLLVTVS